MAYEPQPLDISAIPQIRALVDEVRRTCQSRTLRADAEDVSVIVSANLKRSPKLSRRRGLTREDSLWKIVGVVAADGPTDVSENVDTYLADAYRDTHQQ